MFNDKCRKDKEIIFLKKGEKRKKDQNRRKPSEVSTDKDANRINCYANCYNQGYPSDSPKITGIYFPQNQGCREIFRSKNIKFLREIS